MTSLFAGPMVTVIAGLVFAVFVPSVMSVAVTACVPVGLSVTLSAFVPATSAGVAGKVALLSDDVMPTVWVTFVTTFQFVSTALTVTLNAVPAPSDVGEPVLPVAVPAGA